MKLNRPVSALEKDGILFKDGSHASANATVLAVDSSTAHEFGIADQPPLWRESRCLYYAADTAPFKDSLLRLNGESHGVVNHLAALDQVNPACAPSGKSLIMAGIRPGDVRENEVVEREALVQLLQWFGEDARSWKLLRHDRIKHALLARIPRCSESPTTSSPNVFRCGDYLWNPSIQGSMESGENAAEAVADSLLRDS